MSQNVVLSEVGPFLGDSPETARYRSCDICHDSAVHDVWADAEWRTFYEVAGECGLVVCECCLPGFLAETPGERT